MGGQADAPVDWKGLQTGITDAASRQTANNRVNTSNPFSSQTTNADGSISSQFGGGLGDAAKGLMGQASQYGQAMDWGQFGKVGTGDDARNQAVNASYNQSTSRLDPQWDRRMEANRTQLINQGLDPNSEAAKNSMQDLSFQRNDAYSSAMNNAQMMGQQAGDSVFRNNMASQQNEIANALRQRGMPMQEMQQMLGLMGQPSYGQDSSTLQGAMGSASLAQQQANQKREDDRARAAREAELAGAGMGLAGAGVGAWGALAAAVPAIAF
jgi:hypothetical protein